MEAVANCVIPYVHDHDRNTVSLVSRRWYEIDCMTRKHVTVHLHYAPTPLRLSQRFPFIESLTLKGYPKIGLPQKTGVNITSWIQEISASFKCLKSLHIRNLAIHDSDLELLARTRDLIDLDGEEGCVKWLQELALRNVGFETFSFKYFCDQLDVKDVALPVKNCSKSLVSLTVNTSYIDDLADAFSNAVKLEYFSGALYREDLEYGSFKFPSTIRCLGIYTFRYIDVEADCHCFFLQRCPNLEVLYTEDVCGDNGLELISQFCKKLRKLSFRYCSVTHRGLIALAQGCRNLEDLYIKLTDISNEALECIGINLKDLRALDLWVSKDKNDIETNLTIDDGIRAILIGCIKLERLSIQLDGEILTDVGLGFIGKYGIKLRLLSLPYIGGSVEGLKALSMGCPRLRKLELERCDFSNQDIASFWFNVPSLRYIWVLDKDYETVSALTHPNFGSSTMQARGPYATLSEKLDRQVLHRGIIGSVKSILRQANVNVDDQPGIIGCVGTTSLAEDLRKAVNALWPGIDGVLSSIEEKKSAKEIWDHLARLYEARSLHNKNFLKRKLYALRMTESTSVTEHVNNLNTLFSQLTSLSCKIDSQERAEILLQIFDDVAAAILEEENRRNNREDRQTSSRQVEALVVTRGRSMEPGSSRSHNHGKSKTGKKKNFKCFKCSKPGHFRKDCRGLNTSNPQGNIASTSKDGNALCCEAAVANEGRKILQICNDHELKIIGIGSIMVKMHDGTVRTIRDVRHVEGLKKNLLSLGQLDDLGCKVEIQNKIIKIIEGALVLMRGEKVAANLYQLKGEIMKEAEASVASHSPSHRVVVT
ncbi:hypothetical protein Tco_0697276 [Tanacetum coccineum]